MDRIVRRLIRKRVIYVCNKDKWYKHDIISLEFKTPDNLVITYKDGSVTHRVPLCTVLRLYKRKYKV